MQGFCKSVGAAKEEIKTEMCDNHLLIMKRADKWQKDFDLKQ